MACNSTLEFVRAQGRTSSYHPSRKSATKLQARQQPMSTKPQSRWADDEADAAAEALRKQEKELKKKAKAEKQRQLEEAQKARQQRVAESTQVSVRAAGSQITNDANGDLERPAKRRRLSPDPDKSQQAPASAQVLRFPAPEWGPCRHVDNFEKLNHIEEGSYGWVSRAKESATGEVVALKKLKMDNANDGFPVTGLREIQTLMESRHPNIVNLREVVMGDGMNE